MLSELVANPAVTGGQRHELVTCDAHFRQPGGIHEDRNPADEHSMARVVLLLSCSGRDPQDIHTWRMMLHPSICGVDTRRFPRSSDGGWDIIATNAI
jgi:hypothetical protein